MATGGEGQLTNNQIVRLAAAISSRDMESIALGYLDIEEETIKNFKDARRDNLEAFNRDIIQHWVCKNPEPNQAEVQLFPFFENFGNSLLVSDLRGPPAPPLHGPEFSQFHAVFLEIFGKIVGWCPLLEGWRPLLWKILDPPLLK